MSALPEAAVRLSALIGADEPVFGVGHQLREGAAVPAFGQRRTWSFECIRRPSNVRPAGWKVNFTEIDSTWNLRIREICFSMLNPTHKIIRDAGIALTAEPSAYLSVRKCAYRLGSLAVWALDNQMPVHLAAWDEDDWSGYVEHITDSTSTLFHHSMALSWVSTLAPVLTDGGMPEQVWNTEVFQEARHRAYKPSTASIPPSTWWPLLRAAWTYIHDFSPNILDLRDQLTAQRADPGGRPERRPAFRSPAEGCELVKQWLHDPGNLVPVHKNDHWEVSAGEPIWHQLALTITGGTNSGLFQTTRKGAALSRRQAVLRAVERGQVQAYSWSQMRARTDVVNRPAIYLARSTALLDQALDDWLADPDNLIPIRASQGRGARSDLEAGTVIWSALETMVYDTGGKAAFTRRSATGAARISKIENAVAAGRVQELTGTMSTLSIPLSCEGFAPVTHRDGTTRPWRTHISVEELADEIRMVRAACYVLAAGLTMMRDSEIQEIERGALTSHYGAPAVTSRKIKKDPAQPELSWWISAPIVETLEVLERLSWHDTHLLVDLAPPAKAGHDDDTRRGIDAADEIDFFIAGINTTRHRTGLEEIPASRVRPHMFRRTMSIICSQEPDSEIALGHQLKHLARRAMANRVTQGYSQMDANWAAEFDTQLELAAARRLVDLLRSRRSGTSVAVGPGAAKLHAGLDNVIARMDGDPPLRAQLADDQIEVMLLRGEFADLHFGTVNHCLWDAEQAECQNSLPEAQRGDKPVLGACQPARCRNSVISRDKHAPIWLAEERDLMRMLGDKRLAKPRREALQNRLSEVQLITSAWPTEERV
ncbi:hypothetical protein SAMN05216266_1466 [Amycolatopsis marina]|uniref:Integrase n=1 Tax=Amycolatopsis marina TaxID=490629 RepID=A0A1I1CVR0_9PSEU|nr:hypothetical protein [Amycolatopsis marina]SFB64670.1 hypothetical protein SAMN05216266_1466 [Amycolatopsis marina]